MYVSGAYTTANRLNQREDGKECLLKSCCVRKMTLFMVQEVPGVAWLAFMTFRLSDSAKVM